MERRATGRRRRPGPRRPRHIPRRPAAAAAALACLLAAAPGAAADPALDFGAAVPDTILDDAGRGTGFTRVIDGGGLEPDELKLDTGRGLLLVTSTAGDAARPKDDQDNALSVKVEAAGPYAVEATLVGPLALGVPGQSAGIYVGTGQDDYVKASVTFTESVEGEPSLFLAVGSEGAATGRDWRRSADGLSTASVVLRLAVDPATGAVRASAKVGDGGAEPIDPSGAPIVLPGLAAPASAATAGIITTHGDSKRPFTVAYDRFALQAPPEARLSVGGTFRDGAPQVQVVAIFTHPMDADSVERAFVLLDPSGAPVPAAVTLSADGRTAVLDPQVALDPAATYTARLAATAADADGRRLASAETLALPPAVRGPATSPAPGMAPRGAGDEPLCAPVPEPAPPRRPAPRAVRLTAGQLLVNQRIAQAAIRRAAAIEAWLDAGVTADDLCGGGIGADVLGPGIVTGGTPPGTAPAPARPRRVVSARPPRRDRARVRVAVGVRQLRVGRRIAQIALLRVRALERRLDAGLTGGDLADGAISQAKLAPGLGVLSARLAADPPAASATAPITPPPGGAGRIEPTAAQLRVNQRIAQEAIRGANALTLRLRRGLTGADFQPGSITAVDLAPDLRTS
jgi:hypothetical protein